MVAPIDLGLMSPDGLMLDGQYGFAMPQVADIFQFDKNQASRGVKALMGNDFQFAKWISELHPKAVNVILIQDFSLLTLKLAFKGNVIAQSLSQVLMEEALERRFARAFGVKLDEDELHERLKLRMKRLLARHDWTDVLMNRHVDLTGEKPLPSQYKKWTVTVNKRLFGQPHFCCNRDTMTAEQQKTIYDFESMAQRRAMQHPTISADELVIKALDTF